MKTHEFAAIAIVLLLVVWVGFAALSPAYAARNGLLPSVLGGLASVVGFVLAYHWDLPVGPTDVALLGVVCGLGNGLHWLRSRTAGR